MKLLFCFLWIIPSVAFTTQGQPTTPRFNKIKNGEKRQSDSSRSYANLSDPPTLAKPSFESRMRNIVMKPDKESSSTLPGHPAARRITNLKDYKDLVADSGQLTVVRFYGDYCRACRAMTSTFYRLAQQNSDDMQWLEVPVTPETAAIHQGLGVPSVPFGHIYHPSAGLVEELRLRKEYMADFSKILLSYQSGECHLPEQPNPETGIYDAPYQRHV